MERWISLLGLFVMMLIAWLLSSNRRKMNWRLILTGVAMQWAFAFLILKTGPGMQVFAWMRDGVAKFLDFSNEGASFLFGERLIGKTGEFWGIAFFVLPTIIFVSAVMSVFFHLGVMQLIVKGMAKVMVKVMDASGAESLSASANVFVGHTEAPLVVKPYLETMTRSELMAMMTGGMSTLAGGVLVAYAGMGADAGHLLTASVMSAPASLVVAKIMVPEIDRSPTKGKVTVDIPKDDANVLDAACRGASDGLKLALNVGAMLIAFIAMIGMLNYFLGLAPEVSGEALTFQRILGWVLAPLAWLMGIPWEDCTTVGSMLGTKTILNEFIAYLELSKAKEAISPRAFTITTYALCGFANFGSIAVQIGGIGGLVPSRRKDIAKLGIRSMIGGTLAAFMTACIAGVLIAE